MDAVNENVIEWLKGDTMAAVTAPTASKLKGMITRLNKKYPDEVEILACNQDGSIFAHVPVEYVTLKRPRELSEAQRAAAMQALTKAHELKRSESA